VNVAKGQFGNPEKEKHTPLEAVTRRVVKIVTESTSLSMIASYKV
jgi:hypothetical protein